MFRQSDVDLRKLRALTRHATARGQLNLGQSAGAAYIRAIIVHRWLLGTLRTLTLSQRRQLHGLFHPILLRVGIRPDTEGVPIWAQVLHFQDLSSWFLPFSLYDRLKLDCLKDLLAQRQSRFVSWRVEV